MAKLTLVMKITNLSKLNENSRGSILDNAWSVVQDSMKSVEKTYEAYLRCILPVDGGEIPEETQVELSTWYEEVQDKVTRAEADYREKRFVSVKKSLDSALENLKLEAESTLDKKDDGKEIIEAASSLMEKAYSNVNPLIKQAVDICPADQGDALQAGISLITRTYHEAKRVCARAVAEDDRADKDKKEKAESDRLQREAECGVESKYPTSTHPLDSMVLGTTRASVKFKALENPVFKGEIRDYHRWKQEFQDVMQPRLSSASDAERLMTLKACLSSEVKSEVSATCSTYDDLWKELDKVFGRTQKIVSQVLKEVDGLTKPDDDEFKKQVVLIRTIQKAVKDLQELKCEYEIKNQTILQKLEGKVSNEMFKRWNLRLHDPSKPVDRDKRFDHFMEFL